MKKAFSLNIYGRVQGVGYRYSALRAAKKTGVYGFVKNQADGSVYAEVEGDENKVYEFIKWCYQGPSFSQIQRIEKQEIPVQDFHNFEIRRG